MKGYLLDTEVALWLFTGSDRLKERSFTERFLEGDGELIFHQASTWEIQIKFEIGKLPLPSRPEDLLPRAVRESGLVYHQIQDSGIFFLDRLPLIHRDPFDRLLISHAIINGWTIISSDDIFVKYPVPLEKV